ncbi:MAG: ribonuclease P protein subunit [Candidatus Woesearchaeota archaeon]
MSDLLKKELVGRRIKVTGSSNECDKGLTGKIADETRNTITIETGKGMKKLIKDNITIETDIDSEKISIKGSLLTGRPEDRIKRK